ncbi:MAG: response regulator [Rhizobiaceae bacterium]
MKRCMIVDDSGVIRKVVKRILTSPELSVIEAADAGQALDQCLADMPDTIIVDASLPDMPSLDLIRMIMAIDGPKRPKVALCLPQLDVPAVMRAKRAGASGYILKPFDRRVLTARYRELVAA